MGGGVGGWMDCYIINVFHPKIIHKWMFIYNHIKYVRKTFDSAFIQILHTREIDMDDKLKDKKMYSMIVCHRKCRVFKSQKPIIRHTKKKKKDSYQL